MTTTAFTASAREVVRHAQDQARRLGQHWIGCEHLLLALAAADDEAGELLRGQGVTPVRVEAEIRRMSGHAVTSDDPFDGIDREALAFLGIDLDTVRNRIQTALGPDFAHGTARPAGRGRPRGRGASPRGHLRLTRRAKRCVKYSVHDARSSADARVGTEHLAVALFATDRHMAPGILAALGVSEPRVRSTLLAHRRTVS